MARKIIRVTKKMVDEAEDKHFRTESDASLVKSHAITYLYYKQRGEMKKAKYFLSCPEVKKKVEQLEGGKIIRVKKKRKPSRPRGYTGRW